MAYKYFLEADNLFKQTQDTRGHIYCLLGYGELEYLKGSSTRAKELLSEALVRAEEFSFQIEITYAHALIEGVVKSQGLPLNLP